MLNGSAKNMSRHFSRISLALVLLLSSEVWALGLGDIRMNSALNEPLNARIELLSATSEELDNLTIAMASADTFDRYGIDRPFYLQGMQFNIVRSGRADGNYVQVRTQTPMAEPGTGADTHCTRRQCSHRTCCAATCAATARNAVTSATAGRTRGTTCTATCRR